MRFTFNPKSHSLLEFQKRIEADRKTMKEGKEKVREVMKTKREKQKKIASFFKFFNVSYYIINESN